MKKEYLVTNNKGEKSSFSFKGISVKLGSKDSIDSLKKEIKDKLEGLKNLDSEYEILNESYTLIPMILISCNQEMYNAIDKDPDLDIEENQKVSIL